MKIWQIVIDTNVIIAAIRSKRGASYKLLLTLASNTNWQINLSTALLLEYEEKLKNQSEIHDYTDEEIDDFLNFICSVANEPTIYFRWRPFLKDEDDEMILDLAIAANADFVVTFNIKDFRETEKFNIKAITPFEFLQILGEIE